MFSFSLNHFFTLHHFFHPKNINAKTYFSQNTEKLASHLSSWTRSVSPKLHENSLISCNKFLAPLPGRERYSCVLTSLVFCFRIKEIRLSSQVLQKKTYDPVSLLYKVGNMISRVCSRKANFFLWDY